MPPSLDTTTGQPQLTSTACRPGQGLLCGCSHRVQPDSKGAEGAGGRYQKAGGPRILVRYCAESDHVLGRTQPQEGVTFTQPPSVCRMPIMCRHCKTGTRRASSRTTRRTGARPPLYRRGRLPTDCRYDRCCQLLRILRKLADVPPSFGHRFQAYQHCAIGGASPRQVVELDVATDPNKDNSYSIKNKILQQLRTL